MLRIHTKISFVDIEEYFFNTKNEWRNLISFRRFRHLPKTTKRPLFTIGEQEYTLLISLDSQNEDQILMGLTPDSRNDVRRGYRSGMESEYNKILNEFYPLYRSFTGLKGMATMSESVFESLKNHLIYSKVYLSGELLTAHCHLVNDKTKTARLFCSVSPRLENNQSSVMIGRANKWLTYQDLLFFKNAGFAYYDFGGYALNTNDKQLKGINRFKKMFGGNLTVLHSYYTLPCFLLYQMSKLKQNIKTELMKFKKGV